MPDIRLTPRQRGDLADILDHFAHEEREAANEREEDEEIQRLLESAQQAEELRAAVLGEPPPEPKRNERIQNLYYEVQ